MAAGAGLDRTTGTPWTPTARSKTATGRQAKTPGGPLDDCTDSPGLRGVDYLVSCAVGRGSARAFRVGRSNPRGSRRAAPVRLPSAGAPQVMTAAPARNLRSVARHPTKSRRPAGYRGVTSATELVSGGAPGTGAGRGGGGGACCPECVRKSAATFVGGADSPFTMCMSLPQTRQRGGHRSVPVTQYPQQAYVMRVPASPPRRGPPSRGPRGTARGSHEREHRMPSRRFPPPRRIRTESLDGERTGTNPAYLRFEEGKSPRVAVGDSRIPGGAERAAGVVSRRSARSERSLEPG